MIYHNVNPGILGLGLSSGGEEKWERTPPETSFLDLPPFGIGFLLCNLLRLVAGSNLVSNNQAWNSIGSMT